MTFPVVPEARVPVPPGRALLARCAVAAAWLLIRLRPGRLRRVLGVLARGARPCTAEQALRGRQAVVSVSRACAGQGCLQRSVATVLLCRAQGRWPDWCTGVRTEPFRAHAWVEVDRRPVGEGPNIELFRPLLRVSAPTASRRNT
ncbi:lasso peptide biosynthesis B2 protein [Streptomyces sp. JW3]|uniref:lasso peptide biosynthesis B2 protein n=1 Tax=Streptomyces sp. JW3 TaxID=3456955 RepID=UPI003FA419A7